MQKDLLVPSILFGTLLVFFLVFTPFSQFGDIVKGVNMLKLSSIFQRNTPVVVSPGGVKSGSLLTKSSVRVSQPTTTMRYLGVLKEKPEFSQFSPVREVSTPGALVVASTSLPRSPTASSSAGFFSDGTGRTERNEALEQDAIIFFTNVERKRAGLSSLSFNKYLSAMAEAKAVDMITKQYFSHVSPDGIDLTMLANTYGYQFWDVGENLALGNFSGSADVVLAWMNSSGHRENILNPHYVEIGVAALRGYRNGRLTWYVVQEFGRPFPACAKPEPLLKDKITIYQNELVSLEETLKNLKADIDVSPNGSSIVAQKIEDYNTIVALHNNLVASTTIEVDRYNKEARAFNVCAGLEQS